MAIRVRFQALTISSKHALLTDLLPPPSVLSLSLSLFLFSLRPQFATGTAVVPVGGFAYLQGSAGNLRKFELYGASGHIPRDGLPNAHTW